MQISPHLLIVMNSQSHSKIRTRSMIVLTLLCLISSAQSESPFRLLNHKNPQFFQLTKTVTVDHVNHRNSTEVSYTIRANLKMSTIWQSENDQFIQLEFITPELSYDEQAQDFEKISDNPFYIIISNGQPKHVISNIQPDQTLLNLERAIASLFKLQYVSTPVKETDVSGECMVLYNVKSSTRIEKTKLSCSNWNLVVRNRNEKVFSVILSSIQNTKYDLTADGHLLRAVSTEEHEFLLGSNNDVGNRVKSRFSLEHIAEDEKRVEHLNYVTLEEIIQSYMDWFKVYDLEAEADSAISESEYENTNLEKEVSSNVEKLAMQEIGTHTASVAFSRLLPLARVTKKEEFVKILKNYKELHPQLVDLLGAAHTIESHNAINEVFSYNIYEHWEMLEKYLQSLAIGTLHSDAIIEDLYERLVDPKSPIENKKLYDTLLQTVASLIKRSFLHANDKTKLKYTMFLLENIDKKCLDNECKVLYIRTLQNLNEPKTISNLIKYAETGNKSVSVAAMRALKTFAAVHFNKIQQKSLWEIFFQLKRKYDSSARIYALDILLEIKLTAEDLEILLEYLQSSDKQFEIKTFVIQKLKMLAEKCSKFNTLLKTVLSRRPQTNNYNILAQKGLTTVLLRELSTKPAFNESLLSVQEIESGVLKRGSVDLILGAEREETSNFRLGLYSSGLNSFVSESSDAEIDDEDTEESIVTAGMEISVQGVAMRPLVFFEGQAELMGHVWSGTASEPTLAYLATVLEQNHEHYVVLSSGATVHAIIIGAKSIDLNGRVEISLWNRNARVEIEHNSGIGLVGNIATGWKNYVVIKEEYMLTSQPNLGLQTDIDFSSKIKLCMQLQRPQTNLTMNYNKSVLLNVGKRFVKKIESKQENILQGQTLALNQKNNEMCNSIFSEN